AFNPTSKGIHKQSKGEKNRQPLGRLNVNELLKETSTINLRKNTVEDDRMLGSKPGNQDTAAMDVEGVRDTTNPGNIPQTVFDNPLYPTGTSKVTIDQQDTPSKGPCTVNFASMDIPTPVKPLEFDADNLLGEKEGWVTKEEDETSDGDQIVEEMEEIVEESVNEGQVEPDNRLS
ncbi:MAG: hypothetical protein Q8755_03010, partial [Candidatus Phytoplasma australasiaticum]|nr:hypothetical protein [Candidatus Phytoplasma australasiaticum]